MANATDLQEMFDRFNGEAKVRELLNRYDNVLVGIKDIARFHNVSERTVANYVNDGLIQPEVREAESSHLKFRLSYVLTLDFKKLKKQLKPKRYENILRSKSKGRTP